MGIFDSVKVLTGNTPAQQPPAPAIPQKKVLIIEDEHDLREFYIDLLKGAGLNALGVENGEQGLKMIQEQKPDVVLCDLIMPVMDGQTMLRKLREIPEFKHLPVIVLSNAGDADNIREAKFYNSANEFLIKSNVNPNDIIVRVKSLAGVK